MKPITISQLTCLHTLLAHHDLKDEKASLVQAFTGGRTDSSKRMYLHEAQALIAHLKNLEGNHSSSERMRNKVLSLAHEMGWHLPGTTRVDMKRLNAWCYKYGHAHKALDKYTHQELPALVTQVEKLYHDFLKKV